MSSLVRFITEYSFMSTSVRTCNYATNTISLLSKCIKTLSTRIVVDLEDRKSNVKSMGARFNINKASFCMYMYQKFH